MRTRLEAAVAHEILAEVKDQGRTLKWVQERSGVKSRAWNYYFKGDRPIPFQVLVDVCGVLGLKTSEVIARAEADMAESQADPIEAELFGGLSPRNQKRVEAMSEQSPPSSVRPTRARRSS